MSELLVQQATDAGRRLRMCHLRPVAFKTTIHARIIRVALKALGGRRT